MDGVLRQHQQRTRKRDGHTPGGPSVLAAEFEPWRPHLSSVACSMLGSVSEAEDAVQLAWLRLHRSDAAAQS